MPWTKKEPMDLRIEFAMKAMRTENFRELCAEYGINAKTDTSGTDDFWNVG